MHSCNNFIILNPNAFSHAWQRILLKLRISNCKVHVSRILGPLGPSVSCKTYASMFDSFSFRSQRAWFCILQLRSAGLRLAGLRSSSSRNMKPGRAASWDGRSPSSTPSGCFLATFHLQITSGIHGEWENMGWSSRNVWFFHGWAEFWVGATKGLSQDYNF